MPPHRIRRSRPLGQAASRAEQTWTRRIAVLLRRLRDTITPSRHIRSAEVRTSCPLSELRLAVHCRLTETGDREIAHREIVQTHIPAAQAELGLVFAGIEVTFAGDETRHLTPAPAPAVEPLRGTGAMGLPGALDI